MEWMRVMKILEIYEAGSGQKINLQKTSIFFSQNTSWEKKTGNSILIWVIWSYPHWLLFRATFLGWQVKDPSLQWYQGKSMEEVEQLESEVPFSSWKGNPSKGCHPSNPHL